MAPPLIVVSARAGPINRRLGRVVVEVDHRPWSIPWGMAVELTVDSGTHEVIAYLVLADAPWPLARLCTGARARVEVADGDQRRASSTGRAACSPAPGKGGCGLSKQRNVIRHLPRRTRDEQPLARSSATLATGASPTGLPASHQLRISTKRCQDDRNRSGRRSMGAASPPNAG